MADETLVHLQSLAPATAQQAVAVVSALRSYGLPAVIVSGRRSLAAQTRLYAQGRFFSGPVVTNALTSSKHLQGKAFDILFLGVRNPPDSWWQFAGYVGEWYGLRWGGRWRTFKDKPHFES